MLKVVHDEAEPNEASGSVLDEIVREAARQMLAVALQAEVSAYIDARCPLAPLVLAAVLRLRFRPAERLVERGRSGWRCGRICRLV